MLSPLALWCGGREAAKGQRVGWGLGSEAPGEKGHCPPPRAKGKGRALGSGRIWLSRQDSQEEFRALMLEPRPSLICRPTQTEVAATERKVWYAPKPQANSLPEKLWGSFPS